MENHKKNTSKLKNRKRVFEDVDEKTFQYIKRCKNDNGFVDCHKLFRKIKYIKLKRI